MTYSLHHKNQHSKLLNPNFKSFENTASKVYQFLYRGSIFFDIAFNVLWQSIARKHPMYERTCDSLFFGDGGSKTGEEGRRKYSQDHKFTSIYYKFPSYTDTKGKSCHKKKKWTHPSAWNDKISRLSSSTPSYASFRNLRDHLCWFYFLHVQMSYPSTTAAWKEWRAAEAFQPTFYGNTQCNAQVFEVKSSKSRWWWK